MDHRIFLASAVAFLILANFAWIAIDTRPPFWDMALHQSAALRVFYDFLDNGVAAIASVPKDSGSYPPVYYLVVALFYAVFGKTVDSAQLANAPAIVLLALATYGIARTVMSPMGAALAAVLANYFPFMLWMSRETVIEYWLTSFAALAIWALIKSKEFSDVRWSIVFGVVCGLGMLTKWTFVIYVGLPAAWALRKNWKNAAVAALVSVLISAYWFVPQRGTLSAFWTQVTIAGRNEGDPSVLSWQSIVFYIRALEGYQLFLPLFAAFVIGCVLVAWRWSASWTPIILWLTGSWLALLLISNKDPRFSAPLLPAVAVICALPFDGRRIAAGVLAVFLVFQHYLVSFNLRQLPETVTIVEGWTGPLSFHWNLYTQRYFDLWGRPARENWRIEEILQKVSNGPNERVRLGIIPDIPRFDSHAFEFYINLHRLPVVLNRVWFFYEPGIKGNDYILLSEKDQGWLPHFSRDADRINNYVLNHPELFQVADTFTLPNGARIRLYKCVQSQAS
ncbi:MAG: glycosyltransferase family 39 protein [Acidobacteria bacterium]|nr:glycosyltransferase family 39 protein [Acidobacteriota bacterium]